MKKLLDEINDFSCNRSLIFHSVQRRRLKNAERGSASLCSSLKFCSYGRREELNIADSMFLLCKQFLQWKKERCLGYQQDLHRTCRCHF